MHTLKGASRGLASPLTVRSPWPRRELGTYFLCHDNPGGLSGNQERKKRSERARGEDVNQKCWVPLMKKQLGGGRVLRRRGGALWCNAGSGSGRSLLCGGELECDSCLSDGVVLYWSPSSTTRGDVAMWASLLHCWFLLACLCLFLIATRVTSVSSSSECQARDALRARRRIHIQTNTHAWGYVTLQRQAAEQQGRSLQQRSDVDCVDLSTLVHCCHFHLSPISQMWLSGHFFLDPLMVSSH